MEHPLEQVAKDLHRALVATWIIIEGDEEFLEHIGQCESRVTGKSLHQTTRDAIDSYDKLLKP